MSSFKAIHEDEEFQKAKSYAYLSGAKNYYECKENKQNPFTKRTPEWYQYEHGFGDAEYLEKLGENI